MGQGPSFLLEAGKHLTGIWCPRRGRWWVLEGGARMTRQLYRERAKPVKSPYSSYWVQAMKKADDSL